MPKRGLIHWACWNYPGTRIYTACRVNCRNYRRLHPERECSAAEYVAAYQSDPLGHCATCRKKAETYETYKARFLSQTGTLEATESQLDRAPIGGQRHG